MPNLVQSHLTLSIVGVIPILPTIHSVFLLLPVVLFSALAGLWSLRQVSSWRVVGVICWRFKWHVVVLVTATSATVAGANYLAARRPQTRHDVNSQGTWQMARGGLLRQGSLSQVAPNTHDIAWRWRSSGEAFYSSPALVGERLYIVGSRNDRGRIYCIHAITGEVLWSCAPSGYRATFSSPVIADERLVVGEGLHHVKTGRIVCVDLRAGHEGEIVWTHRTNSHVECTPAIANGRVYVGAGDDGVYCLELRPRGSQANVVWHTSAAKLPDAETSLAVYKDTVYVGLGVGGNALVSLDAETGEVLQRITLPFPVFSPPAIEDDHLYVGMGVGDYVTPHASPAGQLTCIGRESMSIVWNCPLPGTILGAPAITDYGMLCGCADGHIYRIDRAGNVVEKLNTHAPVSGSISVAGARAFAINQAGVLTSFDSETLTRLWQSQVGGRGFHVSSPVVGHGHVYVGTDERGLFCIGHAKTNTTPKVWVGENGADGASGCVDGSVLGSRGVIVDDVPTNGKVTALATLANRVVAAIQKGDTFTLGRWQHDRVTGKLTSQWSQPQTARVTNLAMTASQLFVATPTETISIDLAGGTPQWSQPATLLGVDESHVFLGTEAEELVCRTHDGDVVWTQLKVDVSQPLTFDAMRIALVCSATQTLQLRDKQSGDLLWKARLNGPAISSPTFFQSGIVLTASQGRHRYSILDGQHLGHLHRAGRHETSPLAVRGDRLFYRDEKGSIAVNYHRDSGSIKLFAESSDTSGMLITSDSILAIKGQQLVRWKLNEPSTPTTWLDFAERSTPTLPMVATNHHVIVSTTEGSLLSIQSEAAE